MLRSLTPAGRMTHPSESNTSSSAVTGATGCDGGGRGAAPTPPPTRVQSQSAEPHPPAVVSAALTAAGVQGRLAAQLVAQMFTDASSSRAPFVEAFLVSLPEDLRRQVSR